MRNPLRLGTIGLLAALTVGGSRTADAVVQPKGADAPFVAAGDAPRARRTIAWSRASQLQALGLPGWTAMWDRDTEVPLRLWGPGLAAPGAMRDPQVAEAVARQFLATHVSTLAPGASAADFVVVSNELGGAGDVRSVGFAQYADGVRVLGGAIGVSFKHDRLVMVGSTALPHVAQQLARQGSPVRIAAPQLAKAAIEWLRAEGHAVRVTATSGERVIVPIVRPRGPRGIDVRYQLADHVSVEATAGAGAGAWDVWLDAFDARPIARQSKIHFASGRVLFDVPERSPSGPRAPQPAPEAVHEVNGGAMLSSLDGTVTWAAGSATIAPGLTGPYVAITNDAGPLATASLALDDGAEVVWSRASHEFDDAQLSAFVFASTAKQFARTRLNPNLSWLDRTLQVVVNESRTCNAYSTGDDIHFYRARINISPTPTGNCQNTARIADVVYHEFGHSLHRQSIIQGVGAFDSALSEGLSDMLSAFITKDPGMGRGFFLSTAPLRDLDPPTPKRWPEDTTGEPHDDGEIIGGALWDLRTALVAKHGEAAGEEHALRIYYGIVQRASDIPSTYAEALVSDDDDGDLTNGTPNQCEIDAAFGAHGLADPQLRLGLGLPVRDGLTISISTNPLPSTTKCGGVEVSSVVLDWKVRGGAESQQVLAAAGTTYSGAIPEQPDGTVVQYRVRVAMSDGSEVHFPANPADPYYELYVGEVTPLWCADFEDGAPGWVLGSSPENRAEWEVGAPRGLAGDPKSAHGGTKAFGTDLVRDGAYRRNTLQWADTPVIDVRGHSEVRVQYYRWLGIEDGFYDKARVYANGAELWAQYRSPSEPARPVHHIDKEWRFQDLDVSSHVTSGALSLRFELASDGGFSLGGWTLDDVCVVVPKLAGSCDGDGCGGDEDDGFCSAGGSAGALWPLLGALGVLLLRPRRRS